ncbi:chalcone isomerase family protein [Desulfococcus sp.]|uniref:chalcone isomerase family protein n=1 Tax=Desulfococcus sp. TaxID=2025834 RepID=UPI0035940E2D
MKITAILAAVLMVLALRVDAAANVTLEGVGFGAVREVNGKPVSLKGAGVITYLGIFKLSVAAFYLPKGIPADLALTDVPRRLELEYLHAIKKEDFAESTRVWIRKNTSETAFERLGPEIERFNRLYENVSPGDRYTLAYDPAVGTTLSLNGEEKGTVEGAEFSAALFSIWIGKTPLSDKLRAGLLGLI